MLIGSTCVAVITCSARFLQTYGSAVGEILTGIAAIVATFGGLRQYGKNSKLQRLKWMDRLYTRFYHEPTYKKIRQILDEKDETEQIRKMVADEADEFTDYLNFFEFIAYLKSTRELEIVEINAMFEYYLGLLKRHAPVLGYIRDTKQNGYEHLCKLLGL